MQEIAQEDDEELKSKMFRNLEIDSYDFQNLERMSQLGLTLATKIESCLFIEMKEEISKAYGGKFRDLLASLKNDENTHLRLGLLNGDIKPQDFVRYSKEKLIPRSLIEMREKSQRRYFQENVRIDSDKPVQVVVKSHKGEETFQMYDRNEGKFLNDSENMDKPLLGDNSQNDKVHDPHNNPNKSLAQDARSDAGDHSKEHLSELDELRQKWSLDALQKRFTERIDNHITCNQETKSQLKDYLEKLNEKYMVINS